MNLRDSNKMQRNFKVVIEVVMASVMSVKLKRNKFQTRFLANIAKSKRVLFDEHFNGLSGCRFTFIFLEILIVLIKLEF